MVLQKQIQRQKHLKNDNDDIKEENKKEEEVTTRFSKDGTYEVNVALWNATSDKESMAADAFK